MSGAVRSLLLISLVAACGRDAEPKPAVATAAPAPAPTAVVTVDAGIAVAPGTWNEHLARGRVHAKAKRWPQAIAELEAALAAKPDSVAVAAELGWALFQSQAYERAAAVMAPFEAAASSPQHAALYYNVGRVAEARGDLEAAKQAYRRSLNQRENPSVRARLRALELPRSAGAAAGPFASIEAFCAGRDCAPDPGLTGSTLTAATAPWRAGRIVVAGADCHLAMSTGRGWFVFDTEIQCNGGGRVDELVAREIAASAAGAELLLRLRVDSYTNVTFGAEDELGAHETCTGYVVACGVGPSGVPSCTPAIEEGSAWNAQCGEGAQRWDEAHPVDVAALRLAFP
jgi:tetratricopeptide (TPR) repeat protein